MAESDIENLKTAEIKRIHDRLFGDITNSKTQTKKAKQTENIDHYIEENKNDKRVDTELKKMYAHGFIKILIIQLLFMNGIIIASGLEILKISDTTLDVFMTGTLAEVFGVVLVITRYLFSKK